MMPFCDLHTHSVFSDGTCTPEEILHAAVKMGMSAVALCDHNTVDGLPSFLHAAKNLPIEAVCGAEFSVDYNGTELHLLGLMIDPIHFHEISERMAEVNRRKEESNRTLVQALSKVGYQLDYPELCSRTPSGRINRAHIAAALTEKGYTFSISEAFDTLLSKKGGFYQEPKRLTVWEMLSFLRSIHAVPVLAHPFLNLNAEQLAAFLPTAKQHGLIGIETAYSLYDKEMQRTAEQLADDVGLLPSGGSDFHGTNKPDIALGIGTGSLKVPAIWLEALKRSVTESSAESNR